MFTRHGCATGSPAATNNPTPCRFGLILYELLTWDLPWQGHVKSLFEVGGCGREDKCRHRRDPLALLCSYPSHSSANSSFAAC